MSAKSNASAAPKKSSPAPTQIWIALPFFLFGFLHLAGALVWLICEPSLLTRAFYSPPVIAFSHVVGLGFLMSLVAGSSYQLLPVAFENPLFSRTLAKIHLGLHCVGVPVMVFGFLKWNIPAIAAGGTAVLVGMILFVANVAVTALRPFRRTPTGAGVLVSLASLASALSVAGFILLTKLNIVVPRDPFVLLGAHTYAMIFGFFLPFLAAVSYVLLPMFLLIPLPSTRRAYGSVWYTAGALVLFLVGQLSKPFLLPYAALALAIGLGLYGAENLAVLRKSPRRLDGALRLYAWNLAFVPPALTLVIIRALQVAGHLSTSSIDLDTFLFVIAVFGVLACAILGMGSKIVPFLVWQNTYAPLLGRASVPKLAELGHARILNPISWTIPAAAFALSLGTALRQETLVAVGAMLFLGSLGAFLFNLVCTLKHLWKPTAKPFAARPVLATPVPLKP
ncbi:MAG: hypothetical protein QM790_07795 [Nibricoccus sp.]